MNVCRVNNEHCTAYRLTALQSEYCINHYHSRLRLSLPVFSTKKGQN